VQRLLLRDLTRYVQANQQEFKGAEPQWIEGQFVKICDAEFNKYAYFDWFAHACDGPDIFIGAEMSEYWRAPLWLMEVRKMVPRHLQPDEIAKLEERAGEQYTNQMIDFVADDASSPIELYEDIRSLHILLRQRRDIPQGLVGNEPNRNQAGESSLLKEGTTTEDQKKIRYKRRQKEPGPLERKKRDVILKAIRAGLTGIHYCHELDDADVGLPVKWRRRHPNRPSRYSEAYKLSPEMRHLINQEKTYYRDKFAGS
jgi:hypothetical protein